MFAAFRDRKGFTLVELMIVVAIIGILAAIAIPNFLEFRLKAKTSEAKSNLGAIHSTEVAYFAEWEFYVGFQSLTPLTTRVHHPEKAAWNANTRFSILGFAPEGQVYYSYGISTTGAVLYTNPTIGFTLFSLADLDDDGAMALYYIDPTTNEVNRSGAQPGRY